MKPDGTPLMASKSGRGYLPDVVQGSRGATRSSLMDEIYHRSVSEGARILEELGTGRMG